MILLFSHRYIVIIMIGSNFYQRPYIKALISRYEMRQSLIKCTKNIAIDQYNIL